MKLLKQATYLYWICNSKTIKICPDQHADLLRFLSKEDSFANYKRPGTLFQLLSFLEFFDKNFSLVVLHEPTKFL